MPSGRLRGLLAGLGLAAFGLVVAWFGIVKQHGPAEPPSAPAASAPPAAQPPTQAAPDQLAKGPSVTEAATPPTPAETLREQAKAPAPDTPAEAKAPPEEGKKPDGPSLDVVRVEPSGDSVIAGRGAPGATIEMLRNGRSHARVIADTSGLFAFVPPPLLPGSHEISLSSIAPDGTRAQSPESVTVVINADRTTRPLVTLTSPDRPTVVLSAPDAATPSLATPARAPEGQGVVPVATAPAAAPPAPQPPAGAAQAPAAPRPGIKIASVEAEEGGRLFVSGDAAPGATVRLYLNESFIAPGGTGNDGKVSFAIGRGVRPGDYRVRLDDVDPVSGHVKSRAEVAFNVPPPLTVPLPPTAQPLIGSELAGATASAAPAATATQSGSATQQASRDVAAAGSSSAGAGVIARSMDPGTIIVPEVNTAIVARGDSLWQISRRIYGHGTRYTVIYDANQAQIRNPDRIYPGQLFVVPADKATATR